MSVKDFHDTAMDYQSMEDIKEAAQYINSLTVEDLVKLDETEFRARARERVHHTLEQQLYRAAFDKKPFNIKQAEITKLYVEAWNKRGLSHSLPEYKQYEFLLESAEKLSKGEEIDLTPFTPKPITPELTDNFFTVVNERRSVRAWEDKDVPDELIDKILNAGLAAPHGCNVQATRFVVVKEKTTPGLFKLGNIPGGPVHIVLCQDMRCYEANNFTPFRNRLLDAGAAMENVALAVHAVGLAGVWLTFREVLHDELKKAFDLPDYIRLVTYIDIGYGAQTPMPTPKLDVSEALLKRL